MNQGDFPSRTIADWYVVREIAQNVFWIHEPGHTSFYVFKDAECGLFIDSGLGLSVGAAKKLMDALGITRFLVYCTHTHCDHVGLNDLAEQVFLSREEWEKFQAQNEDRQLGPYIALLRDEKPWPRIDSDRPQKWAPTGWVTDGQLIQFGRWRFRALSVPGHTCGSIAYLEEADGLLLLGDLVYDGTLYLHFSDSRFEEYKRSVAKVAAILAHRPLSLWPSHNRIPLESSFVVELFNTLPALKVAEAPVAGTWRKDAMFESGVLLRPGRFKIVLREDEYDMLKASH